MRKHIHKALSKPKVTLPIFGIVALVVVVFLFSRIGHAPVVPTSVQVSIDTQAVTSGSNVSLSFAKGGRVGTVLVKEGDAVKAGQTIATLYAPDAEGAVNQAKGALDLAQAQYASLQSQYGTTKKQQDLIVANAHRTLLSSGLEGSPSIQDSNTLVVSGQYTCDKEGTYTLTPYASGDSDSGYSLTYSGLESGQTGVKYDNAVALGSCGLQIKFVHVTNFNPLVVWTISIPNTKSSVYLQNKNAYDLVVTNRDKVLTDLANTISANENQNGGSGSVAKAQVDAAQGAYQAALGAYQNNVIVSPVNGVVSFIDSNLKVGQSVAPGKSVISISQN